MVSEISKAGWSAPSEPQTVAFGVPLAEALPQALARFSAKKVAVITTNSLAGPGGLAEGVAKLLGDRFAGVTAGIRPHSPRGEVARIAKALEGADAVVTIGGSSVGDTTKAARLCAANGIFDIDGIDRLRTYSKTGGTDAEPDGTIIPTLPFIAIPTTLSAGEFTSGVGVTDERGTHKYKQVFVYPGLSPDVVILDPAMTLQTPPRLFFSTGMRAVDHAVEGWCSINPTPLSDAYSLHAARLLIPGLRRVLDAPEDLDARLDCMTGSWLSILGLAGGTIKAGASHGMGHALGGTAGVPHGETSCVTLQHVLRYNAAVNGARQQVIAASIGQGDTPLADIIASLIVHLGLPSTLRDANMPESMLEPVADAALRDPLLATNPRPITDIEVVRELFRQAW